MIFSLRDRWRSTTVNSFKMPVQSYDFMLVPWYEPLEFWYLDIDNWFLYILIFRHGGIMTSTTYDGMVLWWEYVCMMQVINDIMKWWVLWCESFNENQNWLLSWSYEFSNVSGRCAWKTWAPNLEGFDIQCSMAFGGVLKVVQMSFGFIFGRKLPLKKFLSCPGAYAQTK